ncbi:MULTISPECIES: glycosyltransferase family 4 protein [Rhizobium]|uniref:Glycosyltransferase family 4 protein n=1 Tax=Rhizobium indicum TaxID=2583231 RepID=A0ABX6PPD5_9HYPH|nr:MULTISPECIES: glycosyltransferase family 4 protein [Rhizobium]NNU63863.1 glycosyltransferase family 4 protein [Rhizobium sp. WYCCWR 11152]QKK20522.1 glycosyltransferase family 4 protein [Rhizobium indicum]QKK33450.1 glycosyltransferase family 4 protein [Rhizobium indicum]
MTIEPTPIRILFVFAWLVVGGEETEVRLLAKHLDRRRYRIDVVACFKKPGMPEQTHVQLRSLGIDVDTTPYDLSFNDTVGYLAGKISSYDVVISCQNVADIYPALERLHLRPPLIEHGGLVSEALAGPKHLTTRYVGVCRSIRDAAAARMPGREHDALEIPSMVDLSAFDPVLRGPTRSALGIAEDEVLIGWVGRLDPKKNVEDFIEAAALVSVAAKHARFMIVGGPDAFVPDYAIQLKALAAQRGLGGVLQFLGDRKDIPALMASFDIFAWLSSGEGMPHVIAEAGAAALPVIATPDNGAKQQIDDHVSGLFVPYRDATAVAGQMIALLRDTRRRHALGTALRRKVENTYSIEAVLPQWEQLLADVCGKGKAAGPTGLFRSFLQGGFECSTHRLRPREGETKGRRLDMIAAVSHDRYAEEDYRQLLGLGIRTVRDGFRWHLIEKSGGYDWSSVRPMIRAAAMTGTQVIWDLLHYGWPDDLDIWSPRFVDRFAAFARACAKLVREECDSVPFYCPVNEISFFSWGGGDAGYLNPFANGRGFELKVQLARAAIAAMDEISSVDQRARFVHCEPVINVTAHPSRPEDRGIAEGHRQSQYQAWDLIGGRLWPQIGGSERYLDVIGVNYYFNNQWIHGGTPIDIGHELYKPLNEILRQTFARYGRPILIAETGIENERRATWFEYVVGQASLAMQSGVPLEGLCLYPIVDHPGWDNGRQCANGVLSTEVTASGRTAYAPLATAIQAARAGMPFATDRGGQKFIPSRAAR